MATSELWSTLETRLNPLFAQYRSRIADLPVAVKSDRTLLTEADIAVEALIVRAIREIDPEAVIIAEEDNQAGVRADVLGADGRIWVIDPIDGTAEFVRADRNQFCSVVCLLEEWRPVSAFVLAPELGAGAAPVIITVNSDTKSILVNGRAAKINDSACSRLSVTRSGGLGEDFDGQLVERGYELKTKTSSQTLDMVRTAISLSDLTSPELSSFDLFWRRKQKVWDGLAGMCLGQAAGLRVAGVDGKGPDLSSGMLGMPTPTFDSTIMGKPEVVSWFLDTVR